MKIAILAGGFGTRMRCVAADQPKSMISINGKPFLWHQLQLLKRHNITEVVLCIGYLGDQIKRYFRDGKQLGMNIQYSEEKTPLGTAGALKNAEMLLGSEFFAMNGDSYLMLDYNEITEFFNRAGKIAVMVVYKNHDHYDNSNVVVEDSVVRLYSRKVKTPQMVYIDAGLYAFKKDVLELIPNNTEMPLDGVFAELATKGQLLAFETKQRFYEIGSVGGLGDFKRMLASA
jgi:NDP-sugar pyrophosphorylase family protein